MCSLREGPLLPERGQPPSPARTSGRSHQQRCRVTASVTVVASSHRLFPGPNVMLLCGWCIVAIVSPSQLKWLPGRLRREANKQRMYEAASYAPSLYVLLIILTPLQQS